MASGSDRRRRLPPRGAGRGGSRRPPHAIGLHLKFVLTPGAGNGLPTSVEAVHLIVELLEIAQVRGVEVLDDLRVKLWQLPEARHYAGQQDYGQISGVPYYTRILERQDFICG